MALAWFRMTLLGALCVFGPGYDVSVVAFGSVSELMKSIHISFAKLEDVDLHSFAFVLELLGAVFVEDRHDFVGVAVGEDFSGSGNHHFPGICHGYTSAS